MCTIPGHNLCANQEGCVLQLLRQGAPSIFPIPVLSLTCACRLHGPARRPSIHRASRCRDNFRVVGISEISPPLQSCCASFDWLVEFRTCSCKISSIFPEHRRSTEVARAIHQAHRPAETPPLHPQSTSSMVSTSTRARGTANKQARCVRRRCYSKRVCANLSSMRLFCDESHSHVWVFRVSLVDSDPSSPNGLLSCALENFEFVIFQ